MNIIRLNMDSYFTEFKILFLLCWVQTALPMAVLNKNPLYEMNGNAGNDITEYIVSKGYVPNEKEMPKTSILKHVDSDVTYLLSKLSDDELVKLLSDQPAKNEYNLQDIVRIASQSTFSQGYNKPNKINVINKIASKPRAANNVFDTHQTRFETIGQSSKPEGGGAFFRLNNREVEPFSPARGEQPQYLAVQKLNDLLYSRPLEHELETKINGDEDEDDKKELLFDVLVAQLKALCCKRNKPKKKDKAFKLQALLSDIMPQETVHKPYVPELKYSQTTMPSEHMFLIINDEIKTNGSEDGLISVDPNSLGKNSSVMLLGPIATPLSEVQLKIVMMRISSELSKPEYVPLLQQIAEGTLSDENIKLVNSLVSGPQTRRYIKPHRCNHQSKLARVYGGPKWIICTGYLNLNTPSLYD